MTEWVEALRFLEFLAVNSLVCWAGWWLLRWIFNKLDEWDQ